VEVVRAATEGGGDVGGVVLSAGGYIVAHHKDQRELQSDGAGEVDRGREGRQVKEDQILVRLEDDEFPRSTSRLRARSQMRGRFSRNCQNGSRPEEVQQAAAQPG